MNKCPSPGVSAPSFVPSPDFIRAIQTLTDTPFYRAADCVRALGVLFEIILEANPGSSGGGNSSRVECLSVLGRCVAEYAGKELAGSVDARESFFLALEKEGLL